MAGASLTLDSEEIKPVAIAIIELCLSEGIREEGSQSVSQKIRQNREF